MLRASPADISVSVVAIRKPRAEPPFISREGRADASVLSELIEADIAHAGQCLGGTFADVRARMTVMTLIFEWRPRRLYSHNGLDEVRSCIGDQPAEGA
jgi:hypothetical protein